MEERANTKGPRRRSRMIGVDFQKIENAPTTRFAREVQKRIAVGPIPSDVLIRGEERELLLQAIERASLSEKERLCIQLTVNGSSPTEISRELGISNSSVHTHLHRAKRKIRVFLKTEYKI